MDYWIVSIGFCIAFFGGGMSTIFYNDAKEQGKSKRVRYGGSLTIAVVTSVVFTLLLTLAVLAK